MDEDEMLKKAIAMSLEEERGVGFAEGEQVRWAQLLSGGAQAETIVQDKDGEEEEMLEKTIAVSLEKCSGADL